MNKNNLEKQKISINKLDDISGSSSVLDSHMAVMYKLSNDTGDIDDVVFQERNKPINK